jgi:hypothetical protein
MRLFSNVTITIFIYPKRTSLAQRPKPEGKSLGRQALLTKKWNINHFIFRGRWVIIETKNYFNLRKGKDSSNQRLKRI